MNQQIPYSTPAKVAVDGIELVYDTFGKSSAQPMLLIAGLGAQMIAWDEEFCEQLAAQGYWIIRFDSRDVGLSTNIRKIIDENQLKPRLFAGMSFNI